MYNLTKIYSWRKDSIGFFLDAETAGYKPNKIPTDVDTIIATNIEPTGIDKTRFRF